MFKETTQHKVHFGNSADMSIIEDNSVELVVTSPPYPMVEMWNESFSEQDIRIKEALEKEPAKAYELMHQQLDNIWKECFRILKPGCHLIINIGDAVKNIDNEFRLFPNHSRINHYCTEEIGFFALPSLVWSKPVNAPNKFMGSGVLPCAAYITLEHEYILVFKKPGKRVFDSIEEKENRRESVCFWEERNVWFSDIWKIKGVRQKIGSSATRTRNASFPIEIPYRLINMFSCAGDTVVDPFYGLGTTSIAAMMCRRNSIGFEIDNLLYDNILKNIAEYDILTLNKMISNRYHNHMKFMREWKDDGKKPKYYNKNMKCHVVTAQEIDMLMKYIAGIETINKKEKDIEFLCSYNDNRNVSESPNEDALF